MAKAVPIYVNGNKVSDTIGEFVKMELERQVAPHLKADAQFILTQWKEHKDLVGIPVKNRDRMLRALAITTFVMHHDKGGIVTYIVDKAKDLAPNTFKVMTRIS